MSFVGNFSHVQVGKEPKSRTQNDNMKKNQGTTTAEKEDNTESTATKTTAIYLPQIANWTGIRTLAPYAQ